jgi:hypothetical protein
MIIVCHIVSLAIYSHVIDNKGKKPGCDLSAWACTQQAQACTLPTDNGGGKWRCGRRDAARTRGVDPTSRLPLVCGSFISGSVQMLP